MNTTPIAYKACKQPETQVLLIFAVDTYIDGSAKNAIIFSQKARDNSGTILSPAENILDQTFFANLFIFTQKDNAGNDVPMDIDGGLPQGEKIALLSDDANIYAIRICPIGHEGDAINGMLLCRTGKTYMSEFTSEPSLHFLKQQEGDLGTLLLEGNHTALNNKKCHYKIAVELFTDTKLEKRIPFKYTVDADKLKNYIGGMIRFDTPEIRNVAAIRFTVLPKDSK
jgi:hypothetical protein